MIAGSLRRHFLSFALVILGAFTGIAEAADPPQIINFQGRLTDTSNNPRSGSFAFTFKLFDAVSGGTQLPAGAAWSESKSITVTNGVFNVLVGSNTSIPAAVFADNTTVYLEVTVEGETLAPRERLIATPYAFNAGRLAGRSYDTFVDTYTAQAVDGVKTFSSFPVKSGGLTPTAGGELVTKAYVDAQVVTATSTIKNQATLQAGATAYPDFLYVGTSATVLGPFRITGVITAGSGANAITTAAGLLDATKLTNTVPNASLDITSVTLQGNAFNGSSQLVQLTGGGALPALNGASLTNLTAANISAGALGGGVIVSSVAIGAVTPSALSSGIYGTVTGVGAQSQTLNMNSNQISNLAAPTADADAATKLYVDASTGVLTGQVAALGASTGTLQTQLSNVGVATGTINTDLQSYKTTVTTAFGNVATSTAAIQTQLTNVAASTGTIQTQLTNVGVATGTLVTLGTNQVVTGVKTFSSSVTVNSAALLGAAGQAVTISSNLVVGGRLLGLQAPTSDEEPATKAYVDSTSGASLTGVLATTNTWTAQQTFRNQITVASDVVVTNGGVIRGDGSQLTSLNASNLASGTVPNAAVSGVYSSITGLGSQSQTLNMNSNKISNLAAPTADADAATKLYIDASTGVLTGQVTALAASTGTLQTQLTNVALATGTINTDLQSYKTTVTTAFNNVGTSTAALQTELTNVAASTGTIQTQLTNIGVATGTINTDLQSYKTTVTTAFTNVGTSTAALQTQLTNVAASTGTIQTQLTAVGVATGTINTDLQSYKTTVTTAFNDVGTSTAALQTQLTNVAASTTTLQTQLTNVGVATGTINTDLQSYKTTVTTAFNNVATSTAAIQTQLTNVAGSTGTIQTQLTNVAVATGTLVTLGTNQVVTGVKTFSSSVTVNSAALLGAAGQAVTISSNLVVGGRLLGLLAPTSDEEPATKAYVDSTSGASLTGVLATTNTWTAQQTFRNQITVASDVVVTNGGVIRGDGSQLTSLNASNLASGTVPNAAVSGVYSSITGLGSQSQTLNMNSNTISNLAAPTADADAATKLYIDASTGVLTGQVTTLQTQVTALGASTGTLQTQLTNVALATGTINTDLQSYKTTVTTAFNNVGTSTAALQTQLTNVAASTTTIQTQLTNVGVATGTINTDLQSYKTTVTTAFNDVGASTAALQTQVTSVAASTGTIQTQLTSVGVATGTINTDLQSYKATVTTAFNDVGTSTASLQSQLTNVAASTGTIQTQLTNVGVATGTLVTLGTNQVVTGVKTFSSSVTVNSAALLGAAGQAVTISSNLVVGGRLLGLQAPASDAEPATKAYVDAATATVTTAAILNRDTLQAGSTFYVSSASVDGQTLLARSSGNVGIGNSSPQHKVDVTGSLYSRRYPLTDGATINIDWNNGNVQSVVLGGDRTLTFSNGQDGGKYILIVKQDGTGSRTLTWPASVRWGSGVPPTLTTTANRTDYIGFLYNGVDSKYDGIATMFNMN